MESSYNFTGAELFPLLLSALPFPEKITDVIIEDKAVQFDYTGCEIYKGELLKRHCSIFVYGDSFVCLERKVTRGQPQGFMTNSTDFCMMVAALLRQRWAFERASVLIKPTYSLN